MKIGQKYSDENGIFASFLTRRKYMDAGAVSFIIRKKMLLQASNYKKFKWTYDSAINSDIRHHTRVLDN